MPEPLFYWSKALPTRPGHYWARESPNHVESVVLVYREEGESELSVRYGPRPSDTVFVQNWRGYDWSHRPIPIPEDEPNPVGLDPDTFVPPIVMKRGKPRARR